MKRASLVALLWALAGSAGAQQPPAWSRPTTPFKVIGNVHYVGTEGLSAFLITSPKGHVLLDGALPSSAPLIARNITALGFKLSDVRLLINSHAHFDHAGGLAELKRLTGARLLASAEDKPSLEGGLHIGDNENGVGRFPAVKVDRIVGDDETVRLGGLVLTALVTPGHTRGCTTWTLPVREAGRTRRVVFHCSTTVAGNVLNGNRAHPNIVADYRRSFARLKRVEADVFLANHPEFSGIPEKRARIGRGPNPFVVAGEYRAFIERSEQAFERELQESVR